VQIFHITTYSGSYPQSLLYIGHWYYCQIDDTETVQSFNELKPTCISALLARPDPPQLLQVTVRFDTFLYKLFCSTDTNWDSFGQVLMLVVSLFQSSIAFVKNEDLKNVVLFSVHSLNLLAYTSPYGTRFSISFGTRSCKYIELNNLPFCTRVLVTSLYI